MTARLAIAWIAALRGVELVVGMRRKLPDEDSRAGEDRKNDSGPNVASSR
jgi:hypothetical protein